MNNSINVYETEFGTIELWPEITSNLVYETKPAISFDGVKYMDTQPKPLPANPAFWSYIDKEASLLEDKHWGV